MFDRIHHNHIRQTTDIQFLQLLERRIMSALSDLQDSVAALKLKVEERMSFDADLGTKLDAALATHSDDSAQLIALKSEVDAMAARLAVLAPAPAVAPDPALAAPAA